MRSRRAISAGLSLPATDSLAAGFMQYYTLAQDVLDQQIPGSLSIGHLILRAHEYVEWELDLEPGPYPSRMLPGFPFMLCHYKEIYIRILARFTVGVGSEQNDLVWMPGCGNLIHNVPDLISRNHGCR